MKYNLRNRRTHQDREINLLNSQRENLLEPIRDFQLFDTEQNCTTRCPLNKMLISNNSNVMLLSFVEDIPLNINIDGKSYHH